MRGAIGRFEKMCEKCGLEVRRLKRIAVGELHLDTKLAPENGAP